jgi:hypothetical protein
MMEERKIDLKRHTSPPVSRIYILKIVFYVVLLSILSIYLHNKGDRNPSIQEKEITEIHHIVLDE